MHAADDEIRKLAALQPGLSLLLRDLRPLLAATPDSARGRERAIIEIDEALRHWLGFHGYDGGPFDVSLQPISLQPVVEWALASCAPEDQDRIDYFCVDSVCVLGDRVRLGIAIASLFEATLATSPEHAMLAVRLTDSPQRATLTVHAPPGGRKDAVGLYFARRLAEQHRGLIASVELRDAVLWCMEIPLREQRDAMALTSPLVLLVDDNISQATALTEMLRNDGIVTKVATSGPEALVRLASVQPDLLVVDMQLRGMNGADVIKRAREQSPDLPAVVVSGYPVDHPLIARTMALPSCRYLGKPIHVQALVSLARAARRGAQRP